MSGETKRLVMEMTVGIVLFNLGLGVLTLVLCPMLGQAPMPILLGLLAGMACAAAMLIHMAVITERVMDSGDQGYANKTTLIHAMGRKAVYIAVLLAVLFKVPQVNPLAMVVGTMGLKAGAYLQPFIRRFSARREKDGLDQA